MPWPNSARADGYVVTAANWNEIAAAFALWGGNADANGNSLTNVLQIGLNGATSGSTTIAAAATASGTLTLPAATDTLVGKATTDTFTNKTFDTAGAGNVFRINGTAISAVTGSGSAVLATSPTLVTPLLGTPTSGTLTNCTGLPISTGVSGLGTNVAAFLATPSSANLISAITDETGSGSLVFANTPTLVTPNIGAATGTSLAVSGAISSSGGAVSDSKGNVREIPQNSQTTGYTLVAADSGKHISITTGGVTVPASVFSAGQAITIYNNSGSNQTITATGVTMYQAGTANTGNRTLAQRGVATILCVASNAFVISGAGVS